MMGEKDQGLFQDVFSKERWLTPLERFIQVLRINIYVTDSNGLPVIFPCELSRDGEFGCKILTRLLSMPAQTADGNMLDKFSPYGEYLEYRSDMAFHVYAIPLKVYNRILAYMIVGPVIMGKRLNDEEYQQRARALGLPQQGLIDEIHRIKAVSHVAMNAVLDLLAAITRDFIDIGLENRRLRKSHLQKEILPKAISRAAEGMYKQIHFDELLVSVLDVALSLTGAEAGSIMMFSKESPEEMMIRVSRGLSDDWVQNARVKMGEGVAGIAAQQNRCFIMRGREGEREVLPFLKRPEIKESIVMPIVHSNHVYGVMNIHTKKEASRIADNSGCLVSLSKLLSTAVFS